MREILFRGREIRTKEWRFGYILPVEGDSTAVIITHDYLSINNYRVDPETVGQFTGLLDRNQQRIFEGDIVKFPDVVNCYISFSRGAFIVGNICPLKPLEERITDYGMCEVIGNVTDNPELLEVNNA